MIAGIIKLVLFESNIFSRFSRAIEAIRVTRVSRILIPEIRKFRILWFIMVSRIGFITAIRVIRVSRIVIPRIRSLGLIGLLGLLELRFLGPGITTL